MSWTAKPPRCRLDPDVRARTGTGVSPWSVACLSRKQAQKGDGGVVMTQSAVMVFHMRDELEHKVRHDPTLAPQPPSSVDLVEDASSDKPPRTTPARWAIAALGLGAMLTVVWCVLLAFWTYEALHWLVT